MRDLGVDLARLRRRWAGAVRGCGVSVWDGAVSRALAGEVEEARGASAGVLARGAGGAAASEGAGRSAAASLGAFGSKTFLNLVTTRVKSAGWVGGLRGGMWGSRSKAPRRSTQIPKNTAHSTCGSPSGPWSTSPSMFTCRYTLTCGTGVGGV